MAQYSKKDILGFIATQIDIYASVDVDAMVKDLGKHGHSIPQEEIERSQKRKEDSFNILLILLDLADKNIKDDGYFQTGDVKEAMAFFNSQPKLS